jgi:TrmH family RNA methyltransferase
LSQNGKYVLLNKIQNPGNLGSIIRTAACFNIDGIIISNDSVDLYHPSIIRATMGSCFSLPIKIVTNLADTIEQMKKYGIMILGTALTSQTKELKQVSIANRAFAVIFGNEGQGLSEVILKMCDEVISIPIDRKKIDSLNVSVSAGIILYHLCNGS